MTICKRRARHISPSQAGAILALVGAASLGAIGCSMNHEEQTLRQSQFTDDAQFGRSIDVSFFTAVVGAPGEPGTVAEEGAAYVFGRSPTAVWSPQARLQHPTGEAAGFGSAVAIWASTIAVGAPYENHPPGGFHSGAVHIFDRNTTDWSETAVLVSSPAANWETFGSSVALEGDTLVVGATSRDQGAATEAGAAFVFQRSGSGWMQQQQLASPSPTTSGLFGNAVDIAGSTLVVGAPLQMFTSRRPLSSSSPGAVFVYEKNGSTWTLNQTLTASDRADGDGFGTSVDLERHADGSRRLIVGAAGCDHAGLTDDGAAYVFDAPASGSFLQTQKLVAATPMINAGFGTDVAVAADQVLIGAPRADGGVPSSGAGYVFGLAAGAWTQQAELTTPAGQTGGALGNAVALSAPYALIGATAEEIGPTATDPGSLHAFVQASATGWPHLQTLNAASVTPSEDFGYQLALDGDTLIVSGANHGDVFRQSAYVWSEEQALLPALPDVQLLDVSTDGASMAVLNRRTLASYSNPLPIAEVEVYERAGSSWTLQQQLDPDFTDPVGFNSQACLGAGIAILGDTMAIASHHWYASKGRVFIWTRSAGVWSQSQVFTSDTVATRYDQDYGRDIRLNGDKLIVTEAPSSAGPPPYATQVGKVYVYTRQGGVYVPDPHPLMNSNSTGPDGFGDAVAIDGDLLAILSPPDGVRIYRRTAGAFQQVFTIPNVVGSRDDLTMEMKGDRLAIALASATVNGVANVGEVRVFRRQPDDSYVLERVFQPSDGVTGLGLGRALQMDGAQVVASSAGPFGRVYTFFF